MFVTVNVVVATLRLVSVVLNVVVVSVGGSGVVVVVVGYQRLSEIVEDVSFIPIEYRVKPNRSARNRSSKVKRKISFDSTL